MAESNQALVLSQNKLIEIDNEYKQLSDRAHFDLSWETDYQAAYRAPAAFLINDKVTNFETTFDRILFHLDEAFKKANDNDIRRAISRTADDQFSQIVFVLQALIQEIKNQNNKGFLEKLTTSIKSVLQKSVNPGTYIAGPASVALTLAPDVINLLADYHTFLLTKWKIQKDETEFYNQVSSVYQKILDSHCFNKEFGLLRNTFTKNKTEILTHVVLKKNLSTGKHLTKFDVNEAEKQESARILLEALAIKQEWGTAIDYLQELKETQSPNYNDLKTGLINYYRSATEATFYEGIRKAIFKGKLTPKEQKVVNKKIMLFTLKIEGKYDEYIAAQKKKKITYSIIGSVSVVILSISFYFYYSNSKSEYSNVAKSEYQRIESVTKEVEKLIQDKKFQNAFQKSKDEIIWNNKTSMVSGDDEKKTLETQTKEYKAILYGIKEAAQSRGSEEMNSSTYGYVYQDLISVYNQILAMWKEEKNEALGKEFSERLKQIQKEIDLKRNQYLFSLEDKIKTQINSGNKSDAIKLLNELYHNSEEDYESSMLGMMSTSYKDFWAGKQKEYQKLIH